MWVERCRLAGIPPSRCISSEAQHMLAALRQAVRAGAVTNELGRTARSWGTQFSAPAEALSYLSLLRAVLSEPGLGAPGADNAWLPVAQGLTNRLMDTMMLEAVDAAAASLRVAARTDALTRCANRLAFNEDLARSVAASREAELDLAVAMVDLDGLKRINDSSGHEAGDDALVALAATLRSVLRSADSLYRIGGDEFVVLARFTDAAGAEAMLSRASMMEAPSFSWGVSSLGTLEEAAFDHPELLVSTADARLYSARRRRDGAEPTRRTRGRRQAGQLARKGLVRRILTATGLATASTALLAVVGALSVALILEGHSMPRDYSTIGEPSVTVPYLPGPVTQAKASHGPQAKASHGPTAQSAGSTPSSSGSGASTASVSGSGHSGRLGHNATTGQRGGGVTSGTAMVRSVSLTSRAVTKPAASRSPAGGHTSSHGGAVVALVTPDLAPLPSRSRTAGSGRHHGHVPPRHVGRHGHGHGHGRRSAGHDARGHRYHARGERPPRRGHGHGHGARTGWDYGHRYDHGHHR